ncbi:hypothetical protein DOY81_015058, partial [Sarcophaga bullata]
MHKILLVDDDRELTSLLKELLEMEGFNVVIAYDGEQALQQIDSSIDLLLLDVMMPKKNGIETLKELRQIHQTPVIMLTARGSELDKVLGLELGADDYLPKPFNDRELVARIRALPTRSELDNTPTLQVDKFGAESGRQELASINEILDLTVALNYESGFREKHLSQEVLGKRLTTFDRAIDSALFPICDRKLPERNDGQPWFKTLAWGGGVDGYLM